MARAFVARWCAAQGAEIVDGVYGVRDDEPTPRIGAALHRMPQVSPGGMQTVKIHSSPYPD